MKNAIYVNLFNKQITLILNRLFNYVESGELDDTNFYSKLSEVSNLFYLDFTKELKENEITDLLNVLCDKYGIIAHNMSELFFQVTFNSFIKYGKMYFPEILMYIHKV